MAASLWIGREAGRVERHAHHAVQIALAMDCDFLMREDHADWREHAGAIVMPHRPHQFVRHRTGHSDQGVVSP